ncbi:MAG: sulfatase [Actinobacteria bacterium]|nr:sulfatase [Actinomycetota bacterium]
MSGETRDSPSAAVGAATGPRNLVVLLLDSLNRHDLAAYGGREFDTPNIDRLAARSVRFTNHHTGSLPCIPARHDILVGAWDFLWKPWGSIELWEEPITTALRRGGVVTQLVTDHPHLFEVGGENYHTDFTAWAYERGHESDPWCTRPDPSWVGAPDFGRGHTHYDNSRGWFRDESQFPGPRTMTAAAHWLATHAPVHRAAGERFMLFVDEFDPHEPFDTPERWSRRYDDTWEGSHLIWPPYAVDAHARGVISERDGAQIRAQYGGKVSMIDHWLGRVLDVLDEHDMWDDTVVILCTDHGHYLGDRDVHGRDVWGKPGVPVYRALGHIPLLVAWPGIAPRTCGALTTSTDLHATIASMFGASVGHVAHGRSLEPLLSGAVDRVRDWLLTGVWGREVQLVTDRWRYTRGPRGENAPHSMWSNRWSTMPITSRPDVRMPMPDARAVLDYMPGSTIPVIRQPFRAGDLLPFWARAREYETILFDRREDPGEAVDRSGDPVVAEAEELLRTALVEVSAPSEQFERLALS